MRNLLIEKLEELNEEELAKLYDGVFGSPEGQLVFEDLRGRCFSYLSTVHEKSHMTHVNEGMRLVILHIENQINLNFIKPKQEE